MESCVKEVEGIKQNKQKKKIRKWMCEKLWGGGRSCTAKTAGTTATKTTKTMNDVNAYVLLFIESWCSMLKKKVELVGRKKQPKFRLLSKFLPPFFLLLIKKEPYQVFVYFFKLQFPVHSMIITGCVHL